MSLQGQCGAAEQTDGVTERALQMRPASRRMRHRTKDDEERGW
jgi:hypothetical protein